MLCPTLAATLFYLTTTHIEKGTTNGLAHELLSVPFSAQGTGILWFMYTLVGLYLLAPIIGSWLSTLPILTNVKLYLILWLVTLCYPLISLVADVNETTTGILYYFGGYVGYFLLGYVMLHHPQVVRWRWLLPIVAIAVIAPMVCRAMHWEVDFYRVFWYLSVFVTAMCAAWFKVLVQWSGRWLQRHQVFTRALVLFSNLSFGIYLSHFFIMRRVLWRIPFIIEIQSYVVQTAVIIVLTLVLSFALSLLISLLPHSEYLIGWHYKRKT